MDRLKITARISLDPDQTDELESLARKCIERVRNEDPGTLQYDWFLREDRSECVVRETYEDSEALLAHLDNLGDLLEDLNRIGTVSVDLFGDPSDELLEAMSDTDTTVYGYIDGLGSGPH